MPNLVWATKSDANNAVFVWRCDSCGQIFPENEADQTTAAIEQAAVYDEFIRHSRNRHAGQPIGPLG